MLTRCPAADHLRRAWARHSANYGSGRLKPQWSWNHPVGWHPFVL